MRGKIAIPIVLVICAMGAGAFALARGSKTKDAGDKAVAASVPIVAGTVAQHDVPIYLTGVGTVIAYNTDVVRAQIQGQIISINFTEGQQVRAGDLLAQIDPRPYQAQIEQFTANRDRDQAQLANALANLNRYTPENPDFPRLRDFTSIGRPCGQNRAIPYQLARVRSGASQRASRP